MLLQHAKTAGNYRLVVDYMRLIESMHKWKHSTHEFLRIIETQLTKSAKESIKETRSPDFIFYGDQGRAGRSFADLSETTMEVRQRKGLRRGDNFILRETSRRIYSHLQVRIDPFGDIQFHTNRNDLVDIHSKGADIQVFGRGSARIPPRPFIGLSLNRERIMYKKLRVFLIRIFA